MTSLSSAPSAHQARSSKMRPGMMRPGFFGLIAGITIFLNGCSVFSPPPMPRGTLLDKEDYNQLIPGSSTRSDVVSLLGTPTAHATFNDNTWLYVTMTKDLAPLSFPIVNTQNVLVLNFDNRGVLQYIKLLDKKDAIPAPMVDKSTKTPGTHISAIQELFGNVGRYNPLTNMGSTFGGMGGTGIGGGPLNGQGTGNGGVGNTMP